MEIVVAKHHFSMFVFCISTNELNQAIKLYKHIFCNTARYLLKAKQNSSLFSSSKFCVNISPLNVYYGI